MTLSLSHAILLILALSLTFVHSDEIPTTSPILSFDSPDTFTQRVKNSDPNTLHLIKFFAPWCGHCQRLEPTWAELASQYNNEHPEKNVRISRVDCTTQGSICSSFGIKGYPSILTFWNGEVVDEYRRSRSLESLTSYIEHMIKPVVFNDIILPMTEELYQSETMRRDSTWLILIEDEGKHFDDEEINTVAENYRGSNVVVSRLDCTKEPELCKRFSKVTEKPAAVLLRAGGYMVSSSAKSAVALKQFVDESIKTMTSGVMSTNRFPRPGVENLESGNWTAMVLAIVAGIVVIGAFFLCLIICLYLEDESEEDEHDGMLTGKDLGAPRVEMTTTRKGLKKD